MRNMSLGLIVLICVLVTTKLTAQIPSTQENIDLFIDSLGRSNDRLSITSKLLPGTTDGTNWTWLLKMVYNKNDDLLWVEEKLRDSVSTSYIFCREQLIFVSHFSHTYTIDSVSKEKIPIFRKVYFDKEKVISDSSPGSSIYTPDFFLQTSRKHLAHFKLKGK